MTVVKRARCVRVCLQLSFADFVWYETIDVILLLDPTILDESENVRAFHARFQVR
jgi:Glutathione S-transferase, C-terminal domain